MSRSATAQRRLLPWHIERRPDPSRIGVYRIVAVLVGLAVSLLSAPFFSSVSPSEFYKSIWSGTFGSSLGMGNLLTIAIPLLLAGLAASIPYRLGLWNVGIDGQMLIGAWMATWVGVLIPTAPGPILIPLMMLAGMIGGAVWIIIPTMARVRLGVSEVITTFLLNFVALSWVTYWCKGPWFTPSAAGGIRATPIPDQGQMGVINFHGITINWAIFVAISLPVVFWVANRFTRSGYELTMIGANHDAGRYAGMNVRRLLISAMLIGGAIAGLAGALNMMGTTHQLNPDISNQAGFNGLVIGVLAGANELGVLALGFIYSLLLAGGGSVAIIGVQYDLVYAIIGVTLIFGSLGEAYARLRLVRTKHPTESAEPPDKPDPVYAAAQP